MCGDRRGSFPSTWSEGQTAAGSGYMANVVPRHKGEDLLGHFHNSPDNYERGLSLYVLWKQGFLIKLFKVHTFGKNRNAGAARKSNF